MPFLFTSSECHICLATSPIIFFYNTILSEILRVARCSPLYKDFIDFIDYIYSLIPRVPRKYIKILKNLRETGEHRISRKCSYMKQDLNEQDLIEEARP